MTNSGFSAEEYIRPDGTLGGVKVLRRETLYRGLNGNRVERFWDARRSYIYKPVGFPKTAGREQWVVRHLKPLISGIRMPEILASSETVQGSEEARAWLIYEDLGQLRHIRTVAEVAEAAGWAAEWHGLPAELVPAGYDGHTPLFEEVAATLLGEPALLDKRLADAGITDAGWWTADLAGWIRRVPAVRTVTHGDYHPGNIAREGHQRIVLDWEFVHRNHPYWDLYCLMDITSFRYRKVPVSNRGRLGALESYRQALAASESGAGTPAIQRHNWCRDLSLEDLAAGYAVYASVYSAWIIGLIEHDLAAGRASRRQLMRQFRETAGVLADCLALLKEAGRADGKKER